MPIKEISLLSKEAEKCCEKPINPKTNHFEASIYIKYQFIFSNIKDFVFNLFFQCNFIYYEKI